MISYRLLCLKGTQYIQGKKKKKSIGLEQEMASKRKEVSYLSKNNLWRAAKICAQITAISIIHELIQTNLVM